MHNNFYFLQHLVPALHIKLKDSVLTNCFSQNKDELIFEFKLVSNDFMFIKASLENHFSCLSFPTNFHRAKRNSINIFENLRNHKLLGVELVLNERSFLLNFSSNKKLLFKLFGNQSNIVYFHNNVVAELFKNKLKKDRNLTLSSLNRPLNTSYEALKSSDWNIRKTIPTLDKKTALILSNSLEKTENKKQTFNNFIKELTAPMFYIDLVDGGYRFNLIKTDDMQSTFTNPILAITSFFEQQIRHTTLSAVKTKLVSSINSKIIQSDNYVKKLSKKLNEFDKGSSNQQKADILMANLHAIPKGTKTIELYNFYTNSPILINLNHLQSPQKNAERYYRKAKNEAKEIAILQRNIKSKTKVIIELKTRLAEIGKSNNIKALSKLIPQQISKKEEATSFKEYILDEYHILVGKNAKHNDTLTLKVANKDDLWLHAKDVSGSHVVIKQMPGKSFPLYIIEKAAQLAAYHSKRKTDTLCPVLYTQKKYVRKKKGTPAGAMFVEKEKVILVNPSPNI